MKATFNNGETISRNTKRLYDFAWAVRVDGAITESGFSKKEVNAKNAARYYVDCWKGQGFDPSVEIVECDQIET